MPKPHTIGSSLLTLLCVISLATPTVLAQLPAFPGAEGFGANTIGGRGGIVVKVTSLEDYYPGIDWGDPPPPLAETPIPGTFRYACEQVSGPRIVVFDVSGNIDLKCDVRITEPYITIAGQTAPGGGVCLRDFGVQILTNEVIIRYMRFRPGAEAPACLSCYSEDKWNPPPGPGCPPDACGTEYDACCYYSFSCCDCPGGNYRDDHHHPASDALAIQKGHNIIIDHCSATWSVDESISASVQACEGNPADPGDPVDPDEDEYIHSLTVQWCILGEALNQAYLKYGDDKAHAFGSLIRSHSHKGTGYDKGISYHHNLYAHLKNRAPGMENYWPRDELGCKKDETGQLIDFRNNVIYNCGASFAGYGQGTERYTRLNYVGNYIKKGPYNVPTADYHAYRETGASDKSYFNDNWFDGGYPADPWSLILFEGFDPDATGYKQATAFGIADGPVTTDGAEDAFCRVYSLAGAMKPARDPVDARIAADTRDGTGAHGPDSNGLINDVDEVGGWPDLGDETRPVDWDTDNDGMPNEWELVNGLDPDDGDDGAADSIRGTGRTNVEDYLNDLADAPTSASFTGVGVLAGSTSSDVAGISADGSVLCGTSGTHAFIWTRCNGIKDLGVPAGASTSSAAGVGISPGGDVVVAVDTDAASYQAKRWDGDRAGSGAYSNLPLMDGALEWIPHGLGTDGSSDVWIAGSSIDGGDYGGRQAGRYAASSNDTIAVPLPSSPAGAHDHSDFYAASDTGAFAGRVQWPTTAGATGGARQAWYYRPATGSIMLDTLLGPPSAAYAAVANAISRDGLVQGGWSSYSGGGALRQAVIWDDSTTPTAIPFIVGGDDDNYGEVLALNGDGTLAGGYSMMVGGTNGPREAFIWDATNGTRQLQTVLTIQYGLDLTGWTLREVRGISADGTVLTGIGEHDGVVEAWVFNESIPSVPEPPADAQADPPKVPVGGSTSLSATPGSGGDAVDWFTGSCGGVPVADPANATLSETTTFFARTRNGSTGCVSDSCAQLTVSVYRVPCSATDACWAEDAKLTGSNTNESDRFGYSVAIDGDTAVVGAPGAEGTLTDESGEAYVFVRDGGGIWTQQARLSDYMGGFGVKDHDNYGAAVDISGDSIIVGLPLSDYSTDHDVGAVYLYEYDGSDWQNVHYFIDINREPYGMFGRYVAISGSTFVVGWPYNDHSGCNNPGAAYVRERDGGGSWMPSVLLTAPSPQNSAYFGRGVAIDGDTIVVGAPYEDHSSYANAGALYVFEKGTGWADGYANLVATLTEEGPGDNHYFGDRVSIAGDVIVVGVSKSNTVYVYEKGTGWADGYATNLQAKLAPADLGDDDSFGDVVSISGDVVVARATHYDDVGTPSRWVYVFAKGDGWSDGDANQVAKLTAVDATGDNQFGYSVAVSGNTILAGASEDGDAGVNAGAAYTFDAVDCAAGCNDCNCNATGDVCEPGLAIDCNLALANGASDTIVPGGGSGGPTADAMVAIVNETGGDGATIIVEESDTNLHPEATGYKAIGKTLAVDTSLEPGEFEMTVSIPFEAHDVYEVDPCDQERGPKLEWFNPATGTWDYPATSAACADPDPVDGCFRCSAPTGELGEYGVYWDDGVGVGYVWAIVDHASDFAVLLRGTAADFDGDTDVDVADFANFQRCFSGATIPPAPGCTVDADFDHDIDVDVADFATFQRCFSGATILPACE